MISYEMDLLSRIEWSKMSLDKFTDGLALNPEHTANWSLRVGLENTIPDALQIEIAPDMPLDPVFITRQLNDIVPSPWQAYDYAKCTIDRLRERPYTDDQIRRDLAFIIEELKKEITRQRDEMAHTVFKNLIDSNDLQFVLIEGCPNTAIPNHIRVDSESRKLRNDRDEDIQRSLFDYRENEFNETEKQVALYIDGQDWIFWWHRNEPKAGYGVRGWRPQVVYTDFIALSKEFSTVYVLETKGLHLIGNEDTAYKRELFKICDDLCKPVPRTELPNELNDPHRVRFRIIDESEWRAVINALAQNSDA